jgi:hypothetical protein
MSTIPTIPHSRSVSASRSNNALNQPGKQNVTPANNGTTSSRIGPYYVGKTLGVGSTGILIMRKKLKILNYFLSRSSKAWNSYGFREKSSDQNHFKTIS